jgi:hypothetical protein
MAEKIIHCSNPHCENEIASVVEIDGRELIHIGGLLVTKIDGACIRCGFKFRWSVTDELLRKIIENMQKNKEF